MPEVARLLRPRGLFAFSHSSPFEWVFWDDETDSVDRRLQRPYFGIHRFDDPEGPVLFNLPHGEWIRLLQASGFDIERLVELQPGPDATTRYTQIASLEWARQWPSEEAWFVRKR